MIISQYPEFGEALETANENYKREVFDRISGSGPLTDFIKSISPNSKVIKVGIRPGEKIHEEMISINDSPNTIELKDKFLICNEMFKEKIIKHYSKQTKVRKVHANFCYSSDDNNFLTSKELKKIHNQAISDKKRFL